MLVDSEGKNLSIYCLITLHDNAPSLSRLFTKYANEWPPRKKIRKGSTRKKINTKKEPLCVCCTLSCHKFIIIIISVNTKKDQHDKRTGSGQHEKRSGSGQHEKENRKWPPRKKDPEVACDLWPLTRDLWPLTLTRKKDYLTTQNKNKNKFWKCWECPLFDIREYAFKLWIKNRQHIVLINNLRTVSLKVPITSKKSMKIYDKAVFDLAILLLFKTYNFSKIYRFDSDFYCYRYFNT